MKSFGKKAWMLPQPVLIIGTYDNEGKPNAMNAAWAGQWDNHEVMISMGRHQTTDNLNLKGEFTLAFATAECPGEDVEYKMDGKKVRKCRCTGIHRFSYDIRMSHKGKVERVRLGLLYHSRDSKHPLRRDIPCKRWQARC